MKKTDQQAIIRTLNNYKQEANSACVERMAQNLQNFDMYHQKQDWSHKVEGQSREFLAKQFLAVEQISSFIKQGLMDLGNDWFSVDLSPGVENPKIDSGIMKALTARQLNKTKFYNVFEDGFKHALLGSLMVFKVHGRMVEKPSFSTKKKYDEDGKITTGLYRSKEKVWELKIDTVSTNNFRPDPSGRGLYILEDIEMDLHEIKAQVYSKDNPDGIYDAKAVEQLQGDMEDTEKAARMSRETGQNIATSSFRKRVRVTECWGTILDAEGNVLHENVVCAMANDKYLIRQPEKNPFWHNTHPYIACPIIRVAHSVWHIALMDAPTHLNKAQNELFNLILDSGIMETFGIKQVRADYLEDPSQVSEGIAPGTTLKVNSSCPPGQKVVERVDTASLSQGSITTYNLLSSEFQQSAVTNDLRLGVLPQRQVKATEVVESSQSITGMLNGIAKSIENDAMEPLLDKVWMTIAQHINDLDGNETAKLLGIKTARLLAQMTNEELFAETVNGMSFKAFGITNTMNKMKDFRRVTAMLQTIAASPVLMEEFAKKYSFANLLDEIMRALDINTNKLKLDVEDMAPLNPAGAPAMPAQGSVPNMQSQIPQVASDNMGGPNTGGMIPNIQIPPSPISGMQR